MAGRRLGGGGLALDAALVAPGRVAGLVVMGAAVSGAPEPELDAATRRFELLLDKAYAAPDAGEINRLETWLWYRCRVAQVSAPWETTPRGVRRLSVPRGESRCCPAG